MPAHHRLFSHSSAGTLPKMRITPKGIRARVTLPLQAHLDEIVSGDTIKVAWMAQLFIQKIEAQGLCMGANEIDAITEQVRKRFRNEDGLTWEAPWQLDVDQEGEIKLDFGQEDLDGFGQFITESMFSVIQDTVKDCTPVFLANILRGIDFEYNTRMCEMENFSNRLIKHWRNPFRLLSAQIALSGKYGEDMNAWLRDRSFDGKDAVIEAITRLHARATQVALEVQILLHNGFADGALSRWRTLHEVSIVALFIQQEGEETARRYLDHLEVESRDMARFLKRAASKSGHTDPSDEELRQIEERVRSLCRAHGDEFDAYYGWASKAIELKRYKSGTGRSKKIKPTFFDIEEAVDMDRLRPYYKLASGAVHAGPKGAFFKLGLLPRNSNAILAGPSNAGLSEAGRLTAWSLSMTCTALMMVEPILDGLIWGGVICELGAQAGEAFLIAEKHLHDEEAGGGRQRIFPAGSNHPRLRVSEKPSARMRRRLAGR